MNIHIYTTYSIFIKALAKIVKNPNLLGVPASCSWCEFPSILTPSMVTIAPAFTPFPPLSLHYTGYKDDINTVFFVQDRY